jgi:ABC-type uncharacterized transport system auxiliary subunit
MKTNIKKLVKVATFFAFVAFIALNSTSCVNIKSDYPEIKYYRLSQTPIHETKAASIRLDKSIFVKLFAGNSDLEASKIVISEDNWTIKRYNYHQWESPLNELLTEFSINRMNRYEIFKKGVFSSVFSVNPDLILECTVINCLINNSISAEKPNNVELSISMNLLQSNKSSQNIAEDFGFSSVFSKTYTKSMARKDNSLETAIDALSLLVAEIVDAMLVDISNNVKK